MSFINIQLLLPRAMMCPIISNVKIIHKMRYMVDVLRCCLTDVHTITFHADKLVYFKCGVNKHQQVMINKTLPCLSQMTVPILLNKYLIILKNQSDVKLRTTI